MRPGSLFIYPGQRGTPVMSNDPKFSLILMRSMCRACAESIKKVRCFSMNRAASICGVPKHLRRSFLRALALSGAGSQSSWLQAQIRRLILEQQSRFGDDLFKVLTAAEDHVCDILADGGAELQQIMEEGLFSEVQATRIVTSLIDCGYVEVRRRAAKTEMARGASVKTYYLTSKSPKYRGA
jgi:hypothetical protein